MRRIRSSIITLGIALLTALGLLLVPGVAQAGTITCGNGQGPYIHNQTSPNSQVWFDVSVHHCSPYTRILTVSGDSIYTNQGYGASMQLDARVACDVYTDGVFHTYRNYNYSGKIYVTVDTTTWIVTLCNYF
jgi:hypothetical protein